MNAGGKFACKAQFTGAHVARRAVNEPALIRIKPQPSRCQGGSVAAERGSGSTPGTREQKWLQDLKLGHGSRLCRRLMREFAPPAPQDATANHFASLG